MKPLCLIIFSFLKIIVSGDVQTDDVKIRKFSIINKIMGFKQNYEILFELLKRDYRMFISKTNMKLQEVRSLTNFEVKKKEERLFNGCPNLDSSKNMVPLDTEKISQGKNIFCLLKEKFGKKRSCAARPVQMKPTEIKQIKHTVPERIADDDLLTLDDHDCMDAIMINNHKLLATMYNDEHEISDHRNDEKLFGFPPLLINKNVFLIIAQNLSDLREDPEYERLSELYINMNALRDNINLNHKKVGDVGNELIEYLNEFGQLREDFGDIIADFTKTKSLLTLESNRIKGNIYMI